MFVVEHLFNMLTEMYVFTLPNNFCNYRGIIIFYRNEFSSQNIWVQLWWCLVHLVNFDGHIFFTQKCWWFFFVSFCCWYVTIFSVISVQCFYPLYVFFFFFLLYKIQTFAIFKLISIVWMKCARQTKQIKLLLWDWDN